ncbi:MAG: hypothetical protein ACTHMG_05550 [Sphingomonas sp.]
MIVAVAAMLLTGLPQAAGADTVGMVSRYREMTRATPDEQCDLDTSDITVCSTRHAEQRLPLHETSGPVEVADRTPGEASTDCAAATGRACAVCPPTGCTGVNLLAVPFKVFRIVRAIVDPDH